MSKILQEETIQIVKNMTNDAYHAETEHLSSSKIKTLLDNPYLFLNPPEREETPYFAIGSATHSLVLEPHKFEEEFAVAPECDRRTKIGKETWENFVTSSAGKTVLTSQDYETAKNMSEALLKNDYVRFLLQNGVAECSFFSEIDGKKVKCRPDYYREDMGIIIDLKTTDDASPDGFLKTVANYGYYIQDPFYCDTLTSLGKHVNKFVFIAVEKKAPYMIGIYELDPVAKDFGRDEYKRAFAIHDRIGTYSEPTYKDITTGDVVQTITLPNWVFYKKGA